MQVPITNNPYQGLKHDVTDVEFKSSVVPITNNPYQGLKLANAVEPSIKSLLVPITNNPYQGLKHAIN